MTLYECAERLGVETHYDRPLVEIDGEDVWLAQDGTKEPRPTLDIAHEVLAKLPSHLIVNYHAGWSAREWDGYTEQHLFDAESFEECVTALAERYLEGEKPT